MIRNFFKGFDMFGASPNLRMRGDSETLNLCGGIASLLILLFFVYIFIIQALAIINYEEIEATISVTVNISFNLERKERRNSSCKYFNGTGCSILEESRI